MRSRGVLPRMRTRHQTRVASVLWFMTVAGHVASKFDVVHDIDCFITRTQGHGGMVTRVASVSWFRTVAGHVASKCDVVHDIDLLDKRAGSWRHCARLIPAS